MTRHLLIAGAAIAADLRGRAYENRPLRIGHGQTISQPYIVAVMTDMARLTAQSRVLEIGTGCGYQTAILSQIAASVTSVERIAALAATARARLARLGYTNIQIYHADGVNGWAAEKAYDAIIVTAAAARRASIGEPSSGMTQRSVLERAKVTI